MPRVKVLLVGTRALAKLLGHLFRNRSEFEFVGSVSRLRDLPLRASSTSPNLIVVSVEPVGTSVRPALACVKKASPSSKLILICPVRELIRDAREWGADACLDQEKLVFHLLPTARSLSQSSLKRF
jgi:hypothetical protein